MAEFNGAVPADSDLHLRVARALAAAGDDIPFADYAERPHREDWTLRSALVRLAQPEPRLAAAVLELTRRIDHVVGRERHDIEAALGRPEAVDSIPGTAVAALVAAAGLDDLAVDLTEWAVTAQGAAPVETVADAVRSLATVLESAGIGPDTGSWGGRPGGRRDS